MKFFKGDYLRLFNGDTEDSPALPKVTRGPDGETNYYCGDSDYGYRMADYYSTQPNILVQFYSSPKSKDHRHEGFRLTFTRKSLTCGSDEIMLEEHDFQGTITSPNWPNNYEDDQYCVWSIKGPSGHGIQLTFDHFEVGPKQTPGNCEPDYIAIFDTEIDRERPKYKLCGRQTTTAKTTGNTMHIQLVAQTSAAGFSGQYSIPECGGMFTGSSGQISNDLLNQRLSDDCVYLIKANPHHRISLSFAEDNFHVPCAASNTGGDLLQVLEYSSEGYFMLKEASTGKYVAMTQGSGTSCPSCVSLVDASAETNLLWYWDNQHMRSVHNFDIALSTKDGVIARDGLEISGEAFDPSSIGQKWSFNSSHVIPVSHMGGQTYLTAENDVLILREEKQDFTGQDFEVEQTQLGKEIGSFCSPDKTPDKNYTSRGNEVVIIHHHNPKSGYDTNWTINWWSDEDICGESFYTDSGSFSSPGYPNTYPSDRRCEWFIMVDFNHRIKLQFTDLDLRTSDGCLDHYVQVFDGVRADSPALTEKICHSITLLPPPIESNGHEMRVIFETDYQDGSRGFMADYTSGQDAKCGAYLYLPLTDGVATIKSTNYPQPYDSSMECQWLLQTSHRYNNSMKITFNDFDVESAPNCGADRLLVELSGQYPNYEWWDYTWWRLCGAEKPETFSMPGQLAMIVFQANQFESDNKGFEMIVEERQCGGVFGASGSTLNDPNSGVLTTPNYPADYFNNEHCTWLLVAPKGELVGFKFTAFNMDGMGGTRDCYDDHDWVDLRNGPKPTSPRYDRFCSTHKPQLNKEFHTTDSALVVIFKTDSNGVSTGFQMEWKSEGSGCGNQLLTDPTGTITSTNFPSKYPEDQNCFWNIRAKSGLSIKMIFTDFNLEEDDECRWDYVEVGNSEDDIFGKYCGHTIPNEFVTDSNTGWVHFRSDGSNSFRGFSMTWSETCGQRIHVDDMTRGTITNPNYGSSDYQRNFDCTWEFMSNNLGSGSEELIKITVKTIDIQGSINSGCPNDFLEFYTADLDNLSQEVPIKRVCGSNAGDIITARGVLGMRFHTDSSDERSGWRVDYEAGSCGGYKKGISGTIDAYAHSLEGLLPKITNCTWTIEAEGTSSQPNMVVRLKEWRAFSIAFHVECQDDYLKIYDGPTTKAELIGKYCGREPPKYIRSTGKYLTLEFLSADASEGFEVFWEQTLGPDQGCGGLITNGEGTITPPVDGNGQYFNEMFCIWEFAVQSQRSMEFDFIKFDLEEMSLGECYDYVEIIDGAHINDEVVFGPQCGTMNRQLVRTYKSKSYLVFVTDEFETETGFEVYYRNKENNCGGTLMANDAEKNFNYKLSASGGNSDCVWEIETDANHYVHVQPSFINFPASTSDYKLPIRKDCTSSQSCPILTDMNSRHVTRVNMKLSGQTEDNELHFILTPENGLVQNEGWDIIMNQKNGDGIQTKIIDMFDGKEVISQNQGSGNFDKWAQNLELRLSDRSFGLFHDNGIEIIFFTSTKDHPVFRHTLNNLQIRTSASRVTVTVDDVKYRSNKNEISLIHEPISVSKGNKVTTIDKFYKLFHWSVEIQINEDPSEEIWKNIIGGKF